MSKGVKWIVSVLVGFSAAYLLWLTILQYWLSGRRGMAAAFFLAAVLALCIFYLLNRPVPEKLVRITPQAWVPLVMLSLVIGGWISSLLYTTLPENPYLLPVNALEISVEAGHHPDSDSRQVRMRWFTTSAGDVSFSQFRQQGEWESTGDGLTTTGDKPASLNWKGRTGEQARLVFEQSPEAGNITVKWNGSARSHTLYAPIPGELAVEHEFSPSPMSGILNAIPLVILSASAALLGLAVGLILIRKPLQAVTNFLKPIINKFLGLPDLEKKNSFSWKGLYILTFLLVFLYVFMEWIFLVTKPSFMDVLGTGRKIEVLLFTASIPAAIGFVLITAIALFSKLPVYRKTNPSAFIIPSTLLPAGILAALLLLLVDNFVYTLFGFGIVSTTGVMRGLVGILFLVLLAYCFRDLLKAYPKINSLLSAPAQSRSLTIILVFLVGTLTWTGARNLTTASKSAESTGPAQRTPHILLITPDGLNAANMSVYGYERDTTTQLQKLAQTALVAENTFSNSGNTAGSIASVFTGKYPMNTRVLYPPDILKDLDSYQHLPGILRMQGYYNIQYGVSHHVDARVTNLIDGFDVVNGREISTSDIYAAITDHLPYDISCFLYETGKRISDRL